MAKKLLKPINKALEAIGLIDESEELENEEEIESDDLVETDGNIIEPPITNKNKIVSIKTGTAPRVLLKKPIEFQDIMEMVDAVKSRRIVVMNLADVDSKLAQRMIDYIVGACYALDASFQEIARYIYIITPENVEVANELKDQIETASFLSFVQK